MTNSTQNGPSRQERVPVEGVRRVWGTLKATTTTAVASTLKKLTTLGDRLAVRKKVKPDANRWWFLIKGDEQLLCELEREWDRVSLQTNWKIERCTKPSDTVVQPPITTAASTSTSAPASLNATSKEDITTPSAENDISSSPTTGVESNTSDSPTTIETPAENHPFQVDQETRQVT